MILFIFFFFCWYGNTDDKRIKIGSVYRTFSEVSRKYINDFFRQIIFIPTSQTVALLYYYDIVCYKPIWLLMGQNRLF